MAIAGPPSAGQWNIGASNDVADILFGALYAARAQHTGTLEIETTLRNGQKLYGPAATAPQATADDVADRKLRLMMLTERENETAARISSEMERLNNSIRGTLQRAGAASDVTPSPNGPLPSMTDARRMARQFLHGTKAHQTAEEYEGLPVVEQTSMAFLTPDHRLAELKELQAVMSDKQRTSWTTGQVWARLKRLTDSRAFVNTELSRAVAAKENALESAKLLQVQLDTATKGMEELRDVRKRVTAKLTAAKERYQDLKGKWDDRVDASAYQELDDAHERLIADHADEMQQLQQAADNDRAKAIEAIEAKLSDVTSQLAQAKQEAIGLKSLVKSNTDDHLRQLQKNEIKIKNLEAGRPNVAGEQHKVIQELKVELADAESERSKYMLEANRFEALLKEVKHDFKVWKDRDAQLKHSEQERIDQIIGDRDYWRDAKGKSDNSCLGTKAEIADLRRQLGLSEAARKQAESAASGARSMEQTARELLATSTKQMELAGANIGTAQSERDDYKSQLDAALSQMKTSTEHQEMLGSTLDQQKRDIASAREAEQRIYRESAEWKSKFESAKEQIDGLVAQLSIGDHAPDSVSAAILKLTDRLKTAEGATAASAGKLEAIRGSLGIAANDPEDVVADVEQYVAKAQKTDKEFKTALTACGSVLQHLGAPPTTVDNLRAVVDAKFKQLASEKAGLQRDRLTVVNAFCPSLTAVLHEHDSEKVLGNILSSLPAMHQAAIRENAVEVPQETLDWDIALVPGHHFEPVHQDQRSLHRAPHKLWLLACCQPTNIDEAMALVEQVCHLSRRFGPLDEHSIGCVHAAQRVFAAHLDEACKDAPQLAVPAMWVLLRCIELLVRAGAATANGPDDTLATMLMIEGCVARVEEPPLLLLCFLRWMNRTLLQDFANFLDVVCRHDGFDHAPIALGNALPGDPVTEGDRLVLGRREGIIVVDRDNRTIAEYREDECSMSFAGVRPVAVLEFNASRRCGAQLSAMQKPIVFTAGAQSITWLADYCGGVIEAP